MSNRWHNESQDLCGNLGGKGPSPEVQLAGLLADGGSKPLDVGDGKEKRSFARYMGCLQSQWTPAKVSMRSCVNWDTGSCIKYISELLESMNYSSY